MTFGSTFGRTFSPTFQPKSQAASAAGWWLAGGIDPANCVAAYQPKGAASYAASKVNLANPGTYDATDGTAPTWDNVNGWKQTIAYQYLKTGIMATNGYSLIVRFSDVTPSDRPYIMGGGTGYGKGIGIGVARTGNSRAFTYGSLSYPAGNYTSGVLAATQKSTNSTVAQEWYNGSLVVDNQAIDIAKFGGEIFLLANSGDWTASLGYIQAAAIYNISITNYVPELTTAMAAL